MSKKIFILLFCIPIVAMSHGLFDFTALPKEIQQEIVFTLQKMEPKTALKTFASFLCASNGSRTVFQSYQNDKIKWMLVERLMGDDDDIVKKAECIQKLNSQPFLHALFVKPEYKEKIISMNAKLKELRAEAAMFILPSIIYSGIQID